MPRTTPVAVLAVALACVCCSAAADEPRYEIDVSVDYATAAFAGTVELVVANTTGTLLQELFFRLYPNGARIYGNAALWVLDARVGDRSVPTQTFVDDTVLLVPLPEPLPPDGHVRVTLEFEGRADDWRGTTPTPDAYGLLTRTDDAMTLTAFYPILALYGDEGWSLDPVFDFGDALMSDASSYDVELTVADGIVPVASGTLDERIALDGHVTYRYTIQGARDFSVVLLDEPDDPRTIVDDVTVRAWFRPEHAYAADVTLDHAAAAAALFADLVGPIPYGEIDLVEVPMQRAAGVEFSGLILIGSGYAADPDDPFYDVIVSHEMAHQWFYAGVGNDVIEHPWLDESLATYLSYLYLDALVAPDVAAATFDQWLRYYEGSKADAPHVTIASPVYAFSRSATYSAFVYSGGAVLLHAVREAVGDGPFFDALSSYYADHLGRVASPNDLLGAFEASCGCRLSDVLIRFGLVR